jgi:hypothetical protein
MEDAYVPSRTHDEKYAKTEIGSEIRIKENF